MKQKTHSTMKKRIKVTGTGKIRVRKSSKQHLLINKSTKAKRVGQSSHGMAIHKVHNKRMQRLLPNL